MSLPSYLKVHGSGTRLSVKVQPRASRHEIAGPLGESLKIKIAAPPVDSAANDALLKFLAGQLGCPRNHVTLVRGQTSRLKTILVQGMSPEDVAAKLNQAR